MKKLFILLLIIVLTSCSGASPKDITDYINKKHGIDAKIVYTQGRNESSAEAWTTTFYVMALKSDESFRFEVTDKRKWGEIDITKDTYFEELERKKRSNTPQFQSLKEKATGYGFKDLLLGREGELSNKTFKVFPILMVGKNLIPTDSISFKKIYNLILDIKQSNFNFNTLDVNYSNLASVKLDLSKIKSESDMIENIKRLNENIWSKYEFENNCVPKLPSDLPYTYKYSDNKLLYFISKNQSPDLDDNEHLVLLYLIDSIKRCNPSASQLKIDYANPGNFLELSNFKKFNNNSLNELKWETTLYYYGIENLNYSTSSKKFSGWGKKELDLTNEEHWKVLYYFVQKIQEDASNAPYKNWNIPEDAQFEVYYNKKVLVVQNVLKIKSIVELKNQTGFRR
ncbi:hypothetical protein [Aneurinibacillus thermoaerophilus]|uniref:hypothetical protein n=1 Tax=Aneurinibacillus thermoaerophilus TaxID=143495 RepID=UPI002E2069E4|nr:hypothetical protein [Aneurinibacillus thermoaerophilus]